MQIASDIKLSGVGCIAAITSNQLVQSPSKSDIHAQLARKLNRRPCGSLATDIIREPGNEGLINFQCSDEAAFRMLQAGIASTGVASSEAHTDDAQSAETGE